MQGLHPEVTAGTLSLPHCCLARPLPRVQGLRPQDPLPSLVHMWPWALLHLHPSLGLPVHLLPSSPAALPHPSELLCACAVFHPPAQGSPPWLSHLWPSVHRAGQVSRHWEQPGLSAHVLSPSASERAQAAQGGVRQGGYMPACSQWVPCPRGTGWRSCWKASPGQSWGGQKSGGHVG